ncbi:MAG: exosortase/archaeosortase family protein [Verrucomicrobia bacterium]|jgi:exosortase|nr:exosortase/archaeosortase family protein [Verrucomicrobiota bacterium]
MPSESEKGSALQTNPQWFSRGLWMEGLAALMVLIGLYGWIPYNFGFESKARPVLGMLYRFWTDPSTTDWHHGMIVPLISLGLVIHRWKDLQKVPIRPSMAGIPLVVGALVLFWVGYKIDITIVGFFSLQLMVGGLILWFLGWAMMKELLFPYTFLLFSYPFYFLDNLVAFPLRGLMCQLSQGFLNLIGVDTMRIGTALVSAPDYVAGLKQGERFALDVATPCSGIRSLFALMMVSALYAHLTLEKTWQKWALFLLSPALAVAGNFARMLMLTFGTMTLGSAVAIGTEQNPTTYHLAAGFAVFIVALGGMSAVGWLLQGGWKKTWAKWTTPIDSASSEKT